MDFRQLEDIKKQITAQHRAYIMSTFLKPCNEGNKIHERHMNSGQQVNNLYHLVFIWLVLLRLTKNPHLKINSSDHDLKVPLWCIVQLCCIQYLNKNS